MIPRPEGGRREPCGPSCPCRGGWPETDADIDAFDAAHGPFPATDESIVKRLADRVMARLGPPLPGDYDEQAGGAE